MNKIEAIKTERDGLEVKEMIARYAKTGWESIPEDDVQRLKWYGLFLRNPTPGFFMIRVRIPGGKTGSYQLRALADIAGTHGNGILDLTTRQQVQLRQIRIEDVPAVFAKMEEVGLTSLQTGMDNVRGVMTCPVAGINPDEVSDATQIVRAITEEILGNPAYSNLPRKFNVAVTGCPDNCVHMETQDLALVPASHDSGHGKSIGYNVLAGGKLGSGGYRIATPLDIFVTEGDALAVSRAIIQIFREHGSRENRTQARLAFLLDEWGESRFRQEVETRVGKTLSPAGIDASKSSREEPCRHLSTETTGHELCGAESPGGPYQTRRPRQDCSLGREVWNRRDQDFSGTGPDHSERVRSEDRRSGPRTVGEAVRL